jgi:hypothetical protein
VTSMTFVSFLFWRTAPFVAPAHAFAMIVVAVSLAHGNARRIPWRVIAVLLSAPLLMLGFIALPESAIWIGMVWFAIANAAFASAMAWRYWNVDPVVAICGLASVWGTFVVLLGTIIH